jgi:bacterioferritin (cytochrome b1)
VKNIIEAHEKRIDAFKEKMEEGHVDWADIQRAQIDQMGIEDYLVNQVGSASS